MLRKICCVFFLNGKILLETIRLALFQVGKNAIEVACLKSHNDDAARLRNTQPKMRTCLNWKATNKDSDL